MPIDKTKLSGLYLMCAAKDDSGFVSIPSEINTYVNGYSIRRFWNLIQPTSHDSFDFAKLDEWFDLAVTNNKKITLRINSSSDQNVAGSTNCTPHWLFELGTQKIAQGQYSIVNKDYDATVFMPLPWDEIHAQCYKCLVYELGRRYGNHPNLVGIYCHGLARVAEWYLLNNTNTSQNQTFWFSTLASSQSDFETKLTAKYIEMAKIYKEAFPHQFLIYNIARPLEFGGSWDFIDTLVTALLAEIGSNKMVVQSNTIAAKTNYTSNEIYTKIKNWRSTGRTGWQFLQPSDNPSFIGTWSGSCTCVHNKSGDACYDADRYCRGNGVNGPDPAYGSWWKQGCDNGSAGGTYASAVLFEIYDPDVTNANQSGYPTTAEYESVYNKVVSNEASY